jgi:hypothetical protein
METTALEKNRPHEWSNKETPVTTGAPESAQLPGRKRNDDCERSDKNETKP